MGGQRLMLCALFSLNAECCGTLGRIQTLSDLPFSILQIQDRLPLGTY